MDKQRSVTVRVPASSANLGPGFDCLGLALDIWNEITVQIGGPGYSVQIEGEGTDNLPHNSRNLILRAMERVYKENGMHLPSGISLDCKNAIPIRSGLGSSASAVIAGLLAASRLLNLTLSKQDLIRMAVEFEGHADNAAACLLGGLVIVTPYENNWIVEKVPIQPIKAIIVLPKNNLSTREARAALPEKVDLRDAADNLSRVSLLIHALRENRMDLLAAAMRDKLHQPMRLKLIHGAEDALRVAYEAGSFGAALSGAGPGLIAFGAENLDAIGKAMQQAFRDAGVESRLFHTQTTLKGALE